MGKEIPITLSFLLVFSVVGYLVIDSNSEDSSEIETFTCEDGQKISLDLENNGIDDCSDGSDED